MNKLSSRSFAKCPACGWLHVVMTASDLNLLTHEPEHLAPYKQCGNPACRHSTSTFVLAKDDDTPVLAQLPTISECIANHLLPLDKHHGLAGAILRSTSIREAWIDSGEFVHMRDVANRWGLTLKQVEEASHRGDIVAVAADGQLYCPYEFLQLDWRVVKAVTNALSTLEPMEKVVFWKRRHGALGNRTVTELLTNNDRASEEQEVLQLAQRWAVETAPPQ